MMYKFKTTKKYWKPYVKLGKGSRSSTYGDYYGIGFGYSTTLTDKSCYEIGCYIQDSTGYEMGQIVFAKRADTTNTALTERMRISYTGNVYINQPLVWY